MQEQAFFCLQLILITCFCQLLHTEQADTEMELATDLQSAQLQFTRVTAQSVFTRENIRGMQVCQR